ncbi:thiol reductant ABC exporter subunit CydD [uncultured Pseudokineococcus sp.]|uniref:thiol reductant ABC exporter subunit CydD n=1 Tax=uncultured Pseudokineococcus sp. TaxID=1642928 RepID=UPI00262E19AE|nr:thiol reductant ABC exporter subunit CydD [uncultured Pseudokineococcus sp.]
MRPLDPRLLRTSRAARRYVVLTALLGGATAVLVVVQSLLLARAVAGVTMRGDAWSDVATSAGWLAVVLALRVGVVWVQERFAHRAATQTIGQLRAAVVAHAARLGRRGLGDRSVAVTELSTRGLDGLEGYLVTYLPQLLLAALLPPALLLVMLRADLLAVATIALTLPLVPLFMALVGWATRDAALRRQDSLQALGAQVLDLVAGLPTLRALGRATGQASRVRAAGDAARAATGATLRMAFLSSLVLEVLTTLSVALVAVGVGLRLVSGSLDLETALVVLLLAPEVYLPLRAVGASFHASADGVAAAEQAFAVLETPLPAAPAREPGRADGAPVRLVDVSVEQPGRGVLAPAGLSMSLAPGRIVALAGPNGCGKSTAAAVLLGLAAPTSGTAVPVAHRRVAWVPQRPLVVPGTLADNVRLATPDADDAALERAAERVGLAPVVAERGWDAPLGQGGVGVSAGQRQRVALARVLLRVEAGADVVVLDEPTAHLDAGTEAVVLATIRELAAAGCAVLVVAHRPELLAVADEVVAVRSAAVDAAAPAVPAPTRPGDDLSPTTSDDTKDGALCVS